MPSTKEIIDGHHKTISVLWLFVLMILLALNFFYNTSFNYYYHNDYSTTNNPYELTECLNCTTYESFAHLADYDDEEDKLVKPPRTLKNLIICHLNTSSLGPITVNKTKLILKWVENQHPLVKIGGFYTPDKCHSRHRVAILVPYRNRETSLIIFLHYIHTILMTQQVEYRIFVIEQCAKDKFNKGTLFNIGFLESQRNESWQCYIFHDVDLIPLDERILYHCPRKPTHMSAAVETHGFQTPYLQLFGGVTALTTSQYKAVSGYSNEYWNWGAEDDDMFIRRVVVGIVKFVCFSGGVIFAVRIRRLQARRFPVRRFNLSIARYAALPHEPNDVNYKRQKTLSRAKRRFWQEGLKSVKYRLLNISNRKLFTHIVADVNPLNIKVK